MHIYRQLDEAGTCHLRLSFVLDDEAAMREID